MAMTLVSHPVLLAPQTDAVLRLKQLQSLDTYWTLVGRLYEGFLLGKKLAEGQSSSLVSDLPS